MTDDLRKTIEPNSSQLNADDLITGPRTVKITAVKVDTGANQQPVSINFEGDNNKPYKPCKSMIRAMVNVWKSTDSQSFVGRSMTLWLDPDVTWGGMAVGGIRISHMSHITREVKMAMTASKTKRAILIIKPLVISEPKHDTAAIDAACDNARSAAKQGKDAFSSWWKSATQEARGYVGGIMDEIKELVAAADANDDLVL